MTVFYAWQGDNRETKQLIWSCLEKAAKRCSLLVDYATRDLSSAEPLPPKILTKIKNASFFVADVSGFLKTGDEFATNPNVMFELGYAVSELGWDNVILVANTDACPIEMLPFDIKTNPMVAFSSRTTPEQLTRDIENILRGYLDRELITWGKQALVPEYATTWEAEIDGRPISVVCQEEVNEETLKNAAKRAFTLGVRLEKHEKLGAILLLTEQLLNLASIELSSWRKYVAKITAPSIREEILELFLKAGTEASPTSEIRNLAFVGASLSPEQVHFTFDAVDFHEADLPTRQVRGFLTLHRNAVKFHIAGVDPEIGRSVSAIELVDYFGKTIERLDIYLLRFMFPAGIPDAPEYPEDQLRQFQVMAATGLFPGDYSRKNYYRGRAELAQKQGMIGKLSIGIANHDKEASIDTEIFLRFPKQIKLIHPDKLPGHPAKSEDSVSLWPIMPQTVFISDDSAEACGQRLNIQLGKIQPGMVRTYDPAAYLQFTEQGNFQITGWLSRDNGHRVDVGFELRAEVTERHVDLADACAENPAFQKECTQHFLRLFSLKQQHLLLKQGK